MQVANQVAARERRETPRPHRDSLAPGKNADLPEARPLERRRLQCYLALILGDIAALFTGYGASGYLYLGRTGLSQGLELAQLVLPLFLTVGLYNGAYSIGALRSAQHGVRRALSALALSAAAVLFISFYSKSSQDTSRVIYTLGLIAALIGVVWVRAQMRSLVRWRCGKTVVNELLIEDGGPAVEQDGVMRISAAENGLRPALDDPAALDRIGQLLRSIDRVIVSCVPERRRDWAMILKGANISGEVIDDAVAELEAHGAGIWGGHGWLRVSVGPLDLRDRVLKRLFDLAVALGALVILAPLMLLVALAILFEDGSPVLFIQRRVGRGNQFFDMLKFRSMRTECSDGEGALSTRQEDLRITRVGRLIRRTSIDELPQLFNVLTGEMSIVGPRPHALGSLAGQKLFWEIDSRYWQRHALKPGLSGLAQVRGLRGSTGTESDLRDRLRADLEYIEGWSIGRDIRILLSTLRVLVHERAY